ncbi:MULTISPECIES: Zn-ribbon domain-containing OB-fold protein [Rhodococcus]|uniref:Zn-ribbon domain-containing OB-fold protein n=1 Tax=Rhodococcus TaxID=1827 RepID=UPI000FFC134D|nr:OB-fold domain-containing protein [Rhodococcus opacus]
MTNVLDLPPLRSDLFTTEPFALVGTQCESGHSSFPTRDFCPVCYSTDVQPIELPPSGTVETFTTVHQAPPGVTVPYHLAFVRLPGPVVLLSRLQLATGGEPQIGDEVHIVPSRMRIDDVDHLTFAFELKEHA